MFLKLALTKKANKLSSDCSSIDLIRYTLLISETEKNHGIVLSSLSFLLLKCKIKGAIEWEIWIQNPDVGFAIGREVSKRISTLSE